MTSIQKVIEIFSNIEDSRTMKRLFSELFTPAELQDVALRWRLLEMLNHGVPQRTIASKLGISLCKITRGSKILKKRQSLIKSILNQDTGGSHAHGKKVRRRPR